MSATTAVPAVTPLWRRLAGLQPHFCNGVVRKPTPLGWEEGPRNYFFSCVVVPPPVPAAEAAFQAHIATLIRGLRHPEFVTVTSYSPFFLREEDEKAYANAAGGRPQNEGGRGGNGVADKDSNAEKASSATQRAIELLSTADNATVPIVLTLTATRATFSMADVQTQTRAAAGNQQQVAALCSSKGRGEEEVRQLGPLDSLTGASVRGINAAIHYFCEALQQQQQRQLPEPAEVVGGGLMVLRGDDHGFTRRRVLPAPAHALAQSPYRDFRDGAELLACCHAALISFKERGEPTGAADGSVTLLTGGYPQGHCLEKWWHFPQGRVAGASAREESYAFLQALDELVAATNVARCHSSGGEDGMPSVEQVQARLRATRDATEKITRRVQSGVAALYEAPCSFSPPRPSLYSEGNNERKDGEKQQEEEEKALRTCIREGLVGPKLLPSIAANDADNKKSGRASVVVTQMVSTAEEFLRYADLVHSELSSRYAATTAAAQEQTESEIVVVIVPGLMAPLPPEEYCRTILQQKVVPSERLYGALQEYVRELAALDATLAAAANEEGGAQSGLHTMARDSDGAAAAPCCRQLSCAIDTFEKAKAALERTFESVMEDDAVDLCRTLHSAGYTHVNFSCFSYRCGQAVARVATRLREEIQ